MQKVISNIFSQESAAKNWYQSFFSELKVLSLFLSSQSVAQPEQKDHFEIFEKELWSIITTITVETGKQFKFKQPLFFTSLNEFLTCFCNGSNTKTLFKDLKTTFDRHLFNLLKEYVVCFSTLLNNNKAMGVHFIKMVTVALSEPLIIHILNVNDKQDSVDNSVSTVKCFAEEILKPLLVADSNPLFMKTLTLLSGLLGFEGRQSYLSYILVVSFFIYIFSFSFFFFFLLTF